MKNAMKKMSAMFMALVMCVSCVAGAMAYDKDQAVDLGSDKGKITISAQAVGQSNGTFNVTYNASLAMSNSFAKVAAVNKADVAKMEALRFICTLSDTLVSQIPAVSDADFTFTSNKYGADEIFVYESAQKVADGIELTYKLNPAVVAAWADNSVLVETVGSALMDATMNMTAAKNITSAQLTAATGIELDGAIKANIYITGIDQYTSITGGLLAAQGSGKLVITPYSTPSSGGGGATATGYNVKVEATENGKLSVDKTWALSGQTIIITAKPDAGYKVGEITATAANGQTVAITKISDTSYSFKMPSSNVTVSGKFAIAEVILDTEDPDKTGVSTLLNTDEHFPYMFGDNYGNFRADASVTRAEVCQMFYNLLRDNSDVESAGFADVAEDAWYAKAINKMAALGVVNGLADNKFAPDRAITRAEFATVVVRFAKANDAKSTFSDVPETHWAYSYIGTAAGYGWIGGVGGNKFEPERNILRAEAATLVNRILGRSPDKDAIDGGFVRKWPDLEKSHWGYYEIAEATTDHNFNTINKVENWIKK